MINTMYQTTGQPGMGMWGGYQPTGMNMAGAPPTPPPSGYGAPTMMGGQGSYGANGAGPSPMSAGGGGQPGSYGGNGYGQPNFTGGMPPAPPMSGAPPQQPPSGGFSSPGGGWWAASQQGYQQNPALQAQFNGLQRSFDNNLQRNVLPSIQSGANAVGGLGGSRQGIAQGLAVGESSAGLADAMSRLAGSTYESDMNRQLQGYGIDQSTGLGYFNGQHSYDLGLGQNQNQANQISNNYNLGNQGQMLDFYQGQRGQDMTQQQLAMQMYGMGVNGPWNPLQNFGNITSPYTGNGTTTQNSSQGGGLMGGIGGGLSGLAFAHQMGWI